MNLSKLLQLDEIDLSFAVLAVVLICCVGALYFFNQEKLVFLQSSIERQTVKVSASLLLEKDKNESTNFINGLFRQRGKLRSSTEESTTSTEFIRQEVDFIIPQKLISKKFK